MSRNNHRGYGGHQDNWHRGANSQTDIEALMGRHAVDKMGHSIGDVVVFEAKIIDGFIAPGRETLKLEVIGINGKPMGIVFDLDHKEVQGSD